MSKLNEEILIKLANTLTTVDIESKELLKRSICEDGKPPTTNSGPTHAWDVRYSAIDTIGKEAALKSIVINRGPLWDLVALLNPSAKELYLFLSLKNIKTLKRENKISHYMPLLSRLNLDNPNTTLDFVVDEISDEEELLIDKFKDMIAKYDIDATSTIVFGFSHDRDDQQFIEMKFDGELRLYDKIEHSNLIDPNYGEDSGENAAPGKREFESDPSIKKEEKKIVTLKATN